MRRRACLVVGLLTILSGCTHRQLVRSTVFTTQTVMDIEYRIVLSNLAQMSMHPAGYPSHIDLADGVVQINDSIGFGSAGGFSTFGGDPFGIDRFGPDGQRQVTEQWGADATTDPERLTELQDLYRVALGLPPLPPPNSILYMRARAAESGSSGSSGSGSEDSSSDSTSTTSPGGGGSTLSSGSESSSGSSRKVPIEVLLADVPPPGWFHVGCKKDVPRNAVYVGHYRETYAWVTPAGMPALARFTVTVQSVIKLSPASRTGGGGGGGKHGLAVTR